MQKNEQEREYIYLYVVGETNATDGSPPLISNNVYSGFGFQFVCNFTEDEARTALEEMAEDIQNNDNSPGFLKVYGFVVNSERQLQRTYEITGTTTEVSKDQAKQLWESAITSLQLDFASGEL